MKVFKEWNVKGSYGPNIVKVMIEELVLRKNKYEKLEKARLRWSLFTLMCLAIFLLFGFRVFTSQGLSFRTNILSVLTGQPLMLVLMLLFAIGFIQIRFFVKKADKAENEFEALRLELIERNTELWEEDVSWKTREGLYSFMKKEHDINLYHK